MQNTLYVCVIVKENGKNTEYKDIDCGMKYYKLVKVKLSLFSNKLQTMFQRILRINYLCIA